MTPEQEKRLREMSIEELNKLTIQKMEASAHLYTLNNDPRHKDWAIEGGKIQGKINAENGHMREIQKLSPHEFPEEAASMGGTATMSGEHAKRIQTMGGSVAGKISQKIERTCLHCNKTIQGPLYFRYHGDKCKFKNK